MAAHCATCSCADDRTPPTTTGWQQLHPGVWIHPEPIDEDAAMELMRQRLAARRRAI